MFFVSQDEAEKMNEELLSEYAFNEVQLLELAGYSSAVATAKVRKKPTGHDMM